MASERFHIARLLPSDVPAYRSLMLRAYELAADAFTSTATEREAEPDTYWVNRIANPQGLSVAFGAFEGSSLVGTVAIEFSMKPKTQHKALLIGMYTESFARGKGVGRALLEQLLEHARARMDLKMLTLTVTEGNESAIRLYERVGFQRFGLEPMAIRTPSGFKGKVHMWMPLHNTGAIDHRPMP